jgi:hypothetical protein
MVRGGGRGELDATRPRRTGRVEGADECVDPGARVVGVGGVGQHADPLRFELLEVRLGHRGTVDRGVAADTHQRIVAAGQPARRAGGRHQQQAKFGGQGRQCDADRAGGRTDHRHRVLSGQRTQGLGAARRILPVVALDEFDGAAGQRRAFVELLQGQQHRIALLAAQVGELARQSTEVGQFHGLARAAGTEQRRGQRGLNQETTLHGEIRAPSNRRGTAPSPPR